MKWLPPPGHISISSRQNGCRILNNLNNVTVGLSHFEIPKSAGVWECLYKHLVHLMKDKHSTDLSYTAAWQWLVSLQKKAENLLGISYWTDRKNIQKALEFREMILKILFNGHLTRERHRIQPFTFIPVFIKKANFTLSMTSFRLNQGSKFQALCWIFGGFGAIGKSEELIKRKFFFKPHSILCSLEVESRKKHWQLHFSKCMHTQPAAHHTYKILCVFLELISCNVKHVLECFNGCIRFQMFKWTLFHKAWHANRANCKHTRLISCQR